jgi:hypothetical protein
MRIPSIITKASNPTPMTDNVMGVLLPLAKDLSVAGPCSAGLLWCNKASGPFPFFTF